MESQERKYLKSLLSDQDYIQFASTLKAFLKNQSDIEALCKDLTFISVSNGAQKADLLSIVSRMIPKSRRTEFIRVFRAIVSSGSRDDKENSSLAHRQQCKKTGTRYLIMERNCLEENFGFKINGDLFTKQEIVASKVDKFSIADVSGLKEGDRIISVNGINCWRARKADIIRLVKDAETLYLEVMCATKFKGERKGKGRETMAAAISRSRQELSKKHVTISTDEHGLLGCCIRGYV